jgi:protein-L-isoaspartate(D-aspartate) O-methyltransferase
VLAVERIPELKAMTEDNVGAYGFVKQGIVRVTLGDGSREVPTELKPPGGFDKIIAAASASEIPEAWKDQVKIGGSIVAPVGHSIFLLRKVSKKKFETKEHFGFSFVPLIRE